MSRVTVHIRQQHITVPALQLVARAGGFLRTGSLITRLREHFRPSGEDEEPFPSQDDPRFNQIVRNLISNRDMTRSMFMMGYAEYERHGIRITDKGRKFLATIPR